MEENRADLFARFFFLRRGTDWGLSDFAGCQKTQAPWGPALSMRTADQYRKLAAELTAKAVTETNQGVAAELDGLARSYLRLAEQAEQNSSTDLWLEVGPKLTLDADEA